MLDAYQGSSHRKIIIFLILFLCWQMPAQAFTPRLAFWKPQSPSIRFVTAAQSIYSAACSGATTVGYYNASGVLSNTVGALTVSLSGSLGVSFYSDASCTTAITQTTIAAGTSSSTFYFYSNSNGSKNITAAVTSFPNVVQAQTVSLNPYIWSGNGGDTNWTNGGNWVGGSAPGASNIAVFNNRCSSNCSPTINAAISIAGIRIESTYSSTITQGSGNSITLSSSWIQKGATFVGSNADISIGGDWQVLAGNFTSTSATLSHTSSSAQVNLSSSANFTHNSGTLLLTLNSTKNMTLGKQFTFNVFTLTGGNGTLNLSGDMEVLGTVTTAYRSTTNGGNIYARGNISFPGFGNSGTTVFRVSGSGNQTITGSSTTDSFSVLSIESTGGTVGLVSVLGLRGYTYVSGTVDAGSSTLLFTGGVNVTFIPGSTIFNNITIQNGSCGATSVDLNGGTLDLTGTFTMFGGCAPILNNGTVNAKGNVVFTNYGGLGNAKINVVGNTDQYITGNNYARNGGVLNMEIASTGGTVRFQYNLSMQYGFKYTSGTVLGESNSTVAFEEYYGSSYTIIPGNANFYNVAFLIGCTNNISISGTMNVSGNATLDGGCAGAVKGGTLAVKGNVNVVGNGVTTTNILMEGAADANLSMTSGSAGNLTVNKSGGTKVNLTSAVSFNGSSASTSVTAGEINMAGYGLTLKSLALNGNTLTKGGGVLTVNGSVASTGALFGGTVQP